MGIIDLHKNLQRAQEKTDAQKAAEAAAHLVQICSRFIIRTREELRIIQRVVADTPGQKAGLMQVFREPEQSEMLEILNKMRAVANEHKPEGAPILTEDDVTEGPDHPPRR